MNTLIVIASVLLVAGSSSAAPRLRNTPKGEQFLQSILDRDDPLPDEVDWRKVPGRVSAIKNSKSCAAGWAFAATGVLEGQQNNNSSTNGDLIPLSEQNLIDCVGKDRGCDEGMAWMVTNAFNFVMMNGINSEKSYPYESAVGKCRFNKSASVMTDKGFVILPEYEEPKLKAAVARYGPVAAAVNGRAKFLSWKGSDIFYDDTCFDDIGKLNQAVLIVGYGTDSEQGDYWLIKNSWGENWADKGYMRLARNQLNMCGIASMATIAMVL